MSLTGATANPQSGLKPGAPASGNPAKSLEEMNMDKLRAKMSKDVVDRNARRVKRRKEMAAKGRDPKEVSEDEKDEFNFVIQMVEKAVEAKLLTSPTSKPSAGAAPPVAAAGTASSTTSMDATLSSLFSDTSTGKNQEAYNPNDTSFHEDYKALLIHRILIPLTMFHSAYLRALQFNDDAMTQVKITRMSADGSSKNFSVLDISKAPPESDLSRANFLEYYNNLLEFVTSIGFGERTLQGLNEHLHTMLSDPQFSRWFEAYKSFDKDYRAKLFKDPFIPDPSSKSWSDGVQRAKDNYLLMQQGVKVHGDERNRREDTQANVSLCMTPVSEMRSDTLVPFAPYASVVVGLDIERTHAVPQLPASTAVPFSLNGKMTHSYKSLTRNMFVSDSTSPDAKQNPPSVMEPTSVPCAQTLTME